MFRGNNKKTVQAFQGTVNESAGLRLLVASFWLAILLCSFLGIFFPEQFVPILLLQCIYKSIFLFTYIIPSWRKYGIKAVPIGITICFAIIIVTWPFFIFIKF
ncbi:MAG: hypothetical protein K2X90_04660 [Candidatus Babeliaceae bacterium]|nr:hypothetical protein [Candidatus Babeliaceae bacterium]